MSTLTTTFPTRNIPCLKGVDTRALDLDIGTREEAATAAEDEAGDTAAAEAVAEEDTKNEPLQVQTLELEVASHSSGNSADTFRRPRPRGLFATLKSNLPTLKLRSR